MTETPSERPPPAASDRRFPIDPEAAGQRLDSALAERLPASREQVRRLLERGAVTLDGRVLGLRQKGLTLAAGQLLAVKGFRPPSEQRIEPEPAAEVTRLAEGPGWLVVDKPAGVPVHPLREGEGGTILNAIAALHPAVQGVGEGGLRSGVVHRLDVETSGCLVVATEEQAWRRLRDAFAAHRVEKVYRAVALGQFAGVRRVELELAVTRHRPARVRVAPGGRGARLCETRLSALRALAGATLVEARPKGGFLHQIRATLAHLGHPIAGDPAYGAGTLVADPSRARRHLLHAARIAVDDVFATSPDPPDFEAALCTLGAGLGESDPA